MSDNGDRMRVVVYYGIWATLCAAGAGIVVAVIHTAFFALNPGRSAAIQTLIQGIETGLALAAGQGAVALVTGSLLAQLGRSLNYTVLLGLGIGLFDFGMYFLQMAVPSTELGWTADIAILVAVTILITVSGAKQTVQQ